MRSILLENSSQGVRENAAEKPAEADAVAKIAKLQTTFSEAGKARRKKLRETSTRTSPK
jgi:hypothetical protein